MNAQFNAALLIFLQFLIEEQNWDGKIGKVLRGKWVCYLSHQVELVFGVHALPLPGPCSSQVVDFVKLSLRRGLQSLLYPRGCIGLGVSSRKISEAFTLIYSFHIFVWFSEPAHLHFCQYFLSCEWRQSWKCLAVSLAGRGLFSVHGRGKCMTQRSSNFTQNFSLLLQQWQSALEDPDSAQANNKRTLVTLPPSGFCGWEDAANFLSDRYLPPSFLLSLLSA